MLPAQGLFRSIPCPYYISGLCERPHCLFRHTKSDVIFARKAELKCLEDAGISSDEDVHVPSTISTPRFTSSHPSSLPLPDSGAGTSSSSIPTSVPKCQSQNGHSSKTQHQSSKPSLAAAALSRKRKSEEFFDSIIKKPCLQTETLSHALSSIKELPEALKNEPDEDVSMSIVESPSRHDKSPVLTNNNNNHIINLKINESESQSQADKNISKATLVEAHEHEAVHKDKEKSNSPSKDSKLKSSSSSSSSSKASREKKSHSQTSKSDSKSSSGSGSSIRSRSKADEKNDSIAKDSKKSSTSSSSSSSSKSRSHSHSSSDRSHKKSSSTSSSSHRSSHSHSSKSKSASNDSSSRSSSSSSSPHKNKDKNKDNDSQGNSHNTSSSSSSSSKPSPSKNVGSVSRSSTNKTKKTDPEICHSTPVKDKPVKESGPDIDCIDLSDSESIHSINEADAEDFNLPELGDYDDDPDDIAMECLKMFEDYKPVVESASSYQEPKSLLEIKNSTPTEDNHITAIGKRRMAHSGASGAVGYEIPRGAWNWTPTPPKNVGRQALVNQIVSRVLEQQKDTVPNPIFNVWPDPPPGATLNSPPPGASASRRKRIAHVPNAAGLATRPTLGDKANGHISYAAAAKINATSSQMPSSSTSIPTATPQETVKKGARRVAHQPTLANTVITHKRPTIILDSPLPSSSKVPSNIRQKVVDMLYNALISVDREYAFKRSIAEEAELEKKARTKATYLNISVNRVRIVRKEVEDGIDLKKSGKAQEKTRISAPAGNAVYKNMLKYILKPEELVLNGFPRDHESGLSGRATNEGSYYEKQSESDEKGRTCDRCRKPYAIIDKEAQPSPDTCTFHPGRKNRTKVGRQMVVSYSCCGGETGTEGCTTVNYHVPKALPVSKMRGFVSAIKPEGHEDFMGGNQWDIVALDCEMVYTTAGSQLARATFVGVDGALLYDTLVKPSNTVLDYNTPFSGLTAEIMKDAKTTITDVQAIMLVQIRKNAILIGHSLESDLIALRFKHHICIDTSVLFPHKMGPPMKRALRNLTSDYLLQIIQNSEEGHDSAEDARAALNLVKYKLEQDRKAGKFSRSHDKTDKTNQSSEANPCEMSMSVG